MPLIDFRNLITELSTVSFFKLVVDTDDYYYQFFYDYAEFTPAMLCEKLGEYLLRLGGKVNCKDSEFAEIYMDTLFPIIRNEVQEKSKADRYLDRLKELYGTIKYSKDEELSSLLEMYTKIVLCIHAQYLKTKKPVSDFSFHIKDVDIDDVCDSVLGAKTKRKIKIPIVNVGASINGIPEQIFHAKEGVGLAAGHFFDMFNNNSKKSKDQNEPIHSKLERNDQPDVLTKKYFVVLLLRIFYYRLVDFELGTDE